MTSMFGSPLVLKIASQEVSLEERPLGASLVTEIGCEILLPLHPALEALCSQGWNSCRSFTDDCFVKEKNCTLSCIVKMANVSYRSST